MKNKSIIYKPLMITMERLHKLPIGETTGLSFAELKSLEPYFMQETDEEKAFKENLHKVQQHSGIFIKKVLTKGALLSKGFQAEKHAKIGLFTCTILGAGLFKSTCRIAI